MTLLKLHEEFIERANRPMTFGHLPIDPKRPEVPIFASERWRAVDGKLVKRYAFKEQRERNEFVTALLQYESEVQHSAEILVTESEVSLSVCTRDVDRVTELDKEYASYADVTYRDVVYSSGHGAPSQDRPRADERRAEGQASRRQ